jgi:hypothetical protein
MTSRDPEALTRPFTVGDLYQNILPYRLYRRELGLDANQDYELALMELLTGARGYLVTDDRMADTLRRELASPNPDSSVFRQFGSAEISISADALASVAQAQVGRGTEGARASVTDPGGVPGGSPASHTADTSGAMSAVPATGAPPMTPTGRPSIVAAQGESCRFCGGGLPAGRALTFCPHCGQDQTVLHCEACGTELEVGWKYCTTCGRGVTSG